MKSRPLSLTIIGFSYIFLMPLLSVVLRAWVKEWPLTGTRGVLTHLSLFEIAHIALMPIVGIGILQVSRWGYFLFLSYSLTLVSVDLFNYFRIPAYSNYSHLLFSLFSLGLVGVFLQKNSAAPFLNSQLKWWQREPRFSVNLGAQIRVKHTVFNCSVLDVATGGCFVEFNEKLVSGETTWIRIHMGEFDFTALARVVWVNPAGVKGVGLRFVGMGRNDRKVLKKLIRFLDNASAHGLKVNQGIPKAS